METTYADRPVLNTLTRRTFTALAGGALASAVLAGIANDAKANEAGEEAASGDGLQSFDSSAWNHDDDNDVYWQIGVQYCSTPAATEYESLGIYVPGAYFDAVDNGDGTFTCTPSETGTVAGYTAATAPIVMPVNTAGYSAQAAPTSYSYNGLSSYLDEGFVYVYAGCRGRSNGTNPDGTAFAGGAPWGVTDLKAAVRFLRANADALPGDCGRIFSFGHSGGGAQSALLGATGDSPLYDAYLESIGAATADSAGDPISDAIFGSMCWCPITSLDIADCAYEWMMGQFSDSGTRAEGTFTRELSHDMAASFADYVNAAGLCGDDGSQLVLEASDEGIYLAGSYYDHLVSVVEGSLNTLLASTTFPYTAGGTTMADGGFAGGGGAGLPDGADDLGELGEGGPTGDEAPIDDGTAPSDVAALDDGTMPAGDETAGDGSAAVESLDLDGETGAPDGSGQGGTTYETVQDYIDSLNADVAWVSYDAESNTAVVAGLEGFVRSCKPATKDVGAFDALDRSQAENMVFGCSSADALHFDERMADLLEGNAETYADYEDWDASYPDAYRSDREILDDLGNDSAYRQNTYNPLYFVNPTSEGYGTCAPAAHWRIRTGIEQGDTALTTEIGLALALQACEGVADVDFATVWGQGHTTAEVEGDSTENFIAWVNSCCAQ